MREIKSISYPNNCQDPQGFNSYTVGSSCDLIKIITKNGEMASINWFEIYKGGEVIAEIKESVCNIYY